MSVVRQIIDVIFTDDEDVHNGYGYFKLYETDFCNFEVLDSGAWYKVDATHPWHELYEDEDVPEGVIVRLEKAITSNEGWNGWRVPKDEYVKHYEDLLRAEFEDVRFLGTDYIPGAIY